MRLVRIAAALSATLAFATPAVAQQQDDNGLVTISTNTPHPVRTAYRAGIEALHRAGYPFIARMSLDQMLVTPAQGPDGRPARSAVRLLFEPRGDSTHVSVTAIVPDSAGQGICRTDQCLSQVLVIEALVTAQLDSALKRVKPSPRTVADSLAEAKAFGYAPENPVRVGGGSPQEGGLNERRYLAALRGPAGEAVTYLRLGSCCEFATPHGIEGSGMLDAYEVRYPGLAKPITLYLDMYTPADPSQGLPAGFTRGAAPAP